MTGLLHEGIFHVGYGGDTDPNSKLAIGIGHEWSWARFMAAQVWAINFAKNIAIYSVPAGFYQVATRL